MGRKDKRTKTKLNLTNVNIIRTEIDSHKHIVYIMACKEVGCGNHIRVRKDQPHQGFCKDCCNLSRRKKPYEALFNYFKHHNPFAPLTYEEFFEIAEKTKCHYCDKPTIRSKHKNASWSGSYMIDRKNNNIGYILSNCVSCCWPCNDLKSDRFTYEQFKQISELIKTF